MIRILRAEFDEISHWSDKRVLYFLFARRHQMEETRKLLRDHLKKMRDLGFDKNPPTFESIKDAYIANPCNIIIKVSVYFDISQSLEQT